MTNLKLLKNSDAVKSWFNRIVVNTALDFLRRNKKVQTMDHEMIKTYSPGEEDTYTDIELKRTLKSLPDKYKSVIILRYFEDMKIDEVAAVLDENVNTIKTRLYQALQILRVKLNNETLKGDQVR